LSHVVVVGSGIAGTAAALAARENGAEVTLVAGDPGASVLLGGALDEAPWDDAEAQGPPCSLPRLAQRVLDALGAYAVGDHRALVAVTTGILRPARGTDRALLDLGPLSRTTVLVVGNAQGAWDAASLARSWNASPYCDAASLSFLAADASLLRHTDEQAFCDAEIAALHDDPRRLAWLAARLRDVVDRFGHDVGALILPPWLGVTHERARALSEVLGLPCGEALGGVGGPSGLRFEHARDRALLAANVRVVHARATRVELRDDEDGPPWRTLLGGEGAEPLDAHAVVLATGGLTGGGLEYTPSGAYFANVMPDIPRPLLRVTCDAPVTLGAFGRALDDASSVFGAAPETHAWPYVDTPLLDHAGILVDEEGLVVDAPRGLYAAGEVAAGAPHTWLAALLAGARAGDAAVRG
jgi:glycerol-3-phosphate dehydrogenase subunit B